MPESPETTPARGKTGTNPAPTKATGAHDDQVDAMTQALLRSQMAPREPVVYYYYPEPYRISPI